jgi:putative phosphotransacetylase
MTIKIPIEISARHVHLAKEEMEILFGSGYELKILKELSQPGQFAANETLTVRFGDKEIINVRVVGPLRQKTQVEISLTDTYFLGAAATIKEDQGYMKVAPGILLIGPKGEVGLEQGALVALRHLNASLAEAEELGIKDNEFVSIRIKGIRDLTFHNVRTKVGDQYKLSVHLDADEGNAAGLIQKGFGEIT